MTGFSTYVHPSAVLGEEFKPSPCLVVDAEVKLGDRVITGAFVHIRYGAQIADDVMIGDHVTIHEGAVIGAGTVIAEGAVVGRRPALSPRSTAKGGPLPGLEVGEKCIIGCNAVLMAGSKLANGVIVGDGAGIRERCTVGEGSVVGRNVTVENDTTIGARVKIQSGAYVTAYVTLEDDVFIAPMVVTTNDNYMGRTDKRLTELKGATVRRGARVGGGTHILPGIEIGEEAFIATGAVVTKNVPAKTLVMGVPAKVVRDVPEEELLENQ